MSQQDDPFDVAHATVEAAAQGKASLAKAREAFLEVAEFRPKGMSYKEDEDPIQKLYSEAANSLKMALDALEGDQNHLALSYTKVAKIKLDKAREG